MKKPQIFKTIRFRLTIWYGAFFILLIFALMFSVNLVMQKYHTPPLRDFQSAAEFQAWIQTMDDANINFGRELRRYSIMGVGMVILAGALGGYFLSGKMLKPINQVTSLAESISYTNLKKRLNYTESNDEIKHLADTFDKMLARLEQASESQKNFIQDASHELRTPIATALTNIEVLEMNVAATREDYQHLVTILKLSLERMNNISNGLLLLSDGAAAMKHKSSVNLAGLITDTIKEIEPAARAQQVTMAWDMPTPDIFVPGDSYRIKQTVFNLVDNAVKYNRPGGSVAVSLSAQGKSAVIEVTDTGIGIAPEDLPHLFDRFFRVDKSRSRKKGGSGLGLAIVKKIVEEHGGTVSAASTPGEGSSFVATFPRR